MKEITPLLSDQRAHMHISEAIDQAGGFRRRHAYLVVLGVWGWIAQPGFVGVIPHINADISAEFDYSPPMAGLSDSLFFIGLLVGSGGGYPSVRMAGASAPVLRIVASAGEPALAAVGREGGGGPCNHGPNRGGAKVPTRPLFLVPGVGPALGRLYVWRWRWPLLRWAAVVSVVGVGSRQTAVDIRTPASGGLQWTRTPTRDRSWTTGGARGPDSSSCSPRTCG
jgi:hypothetical protein